MINLLRCRFSTGSSSIKSSRVEKPDLTLQQAASTINALSVCCSAFID